MQTQIVDDRDFDFLEPDFFDDGTVPGARGPNADELWKQQCDPSYISVFLNEQRTADKNRKTELVRRRAMAIMAYEEFCRQDNGYFHSRDNAETMFDNMRQAIKIVPGWEYTTEKLAELFPILKAKNFLDLGPNRGYTNAEVEKMNAREYRDSITHPIASDRRAENEEIAASQVVEEFRPTRSQQSQVSDAISRNGKIRLAGLKTIFPDLTIEQCAIVADSVAQSSGVGAKRTWYQ